MPNGKSRSGFGWIDPRDLTGGAGAWPSGSGGGAGITGGAGGSGGGAGVTGAAGGRPRSGVTATGDAGPYDPFGEVTGDAGPYDPYDSFGITGGAGPYNAGDDNQTSWSQFFSGDRSLLASDVPKPTTNLTPYLAIGVVALIAFVALKK